MDLDLAFGFQDDTHATRSRDQTRVGESPTEGVSAHLREIMAK